MSLARCIYNCEDNDDCEDACVDQFKGRTADCPCEVGIIILYEFNCNQIMKYFNLLIKRVLKHYLGKLPWWMSMRLIRM